MKGEKEVSVDGGGDEKEDGEKEEVSFHIKSFRTLITRIINFFLWHMLQYVF